MLDKVVSEAVVGTAPAHGAANGTEGRQESTGANGAEPAGVGTAPVLEKKTRRTRRRTTPPANGSGNQAAEAMAAATTTQPADPTADQQSELLGAMSERYVTFLHNFQRDRTLPPHPIIEPGYDITTLSIDELSSSDEVYNRELSWLDFNWRVLHEAVDSRTPLLERLKFIAITSSNLDEYFSKRVGGLKRQKAAGVANLTLDGWAPDVQLALIAATVREMISVESDCLHDDILPALAKHGIRVFNYDELTPAQHEKLTSFYQKEVYPILTPLAVDPGHPFPFISNLSLSLGVVLRDPQSGDVQFARVKVPQTRQRWVPLDSPMHFVPLEQVITANLDTLFKGMEVLAVYPFRVTRNADLARNEEEADDLLEMISEELRERRFAPVVRLEVDEKMPADVLALLQNQLHLDNDDVYHVRGLLRRVDLFALADINLPHLKYEPWTPLAPSRFAGINSKGRPGEMFSAIRQGDIIVHHPYQSFQGSTQIVCGGGGTRLPGAGHQADALPHERQFADYCCADPGCRDGQAGGGARRGQGTV